MEFGSVNVQQRLDTLQKRICYLTIVFLIRNATVDMVLWDDTRIAKSHGSLTMILVM